MDFALSDEQREFKDLCHRFAAEVIRPVAAKHDAEESTPWEVIKAAREWGLNGIEHLQRLGSDPDGQFSVIYAEELHWGCAGIALAISGSALAAAGLAASGTPEQIAKWVPECFGVGDEIKLGAYAVTEPQAGSDVKSLRTTAKLRRRRVGPQRHQGLHHQRRDRRRPRGRRDGRPRARTPGPGLVRDREGNAGPDAGQEGVQARHPRLPHGRGDPGGVPDPGREPARRHGQARAQARARRAPGSRAAAPPGALATFELTRPIVGASALGIAQAAYEWTLAYLDTDVAADPIAEYLDESSTAGRPPLQRQAIQQRLADVATEIEAGRLLVQRASWMGRNGIPMTGGQGSMSKLKGGDVAMWATRTCMDLVGPYAQTTDCPLEKWFRDAKIYQLFEGTAEIQRLVVSRMQAAEYRERLADGARSRRTRWPDRGARAPRAARTASGRERPPSRRTAPVARRSRLQAPPECRRAWRGSFIRPAAAKAPRVSVPIAPDEHPDEHVVLGKHASSPEMDGR